MARGNREIKLTPVDDDSSHRAPVIRLESKETLDLAKMRRQETANQEAKRLEVPAREEFEFRTREPDTHLLSGAGGWTGRFTELPWNDEIPRDSGFFRGSFMIIALGLAGFAIWSLQPAAEKIQGPTAPDLALATEVAENLEATQLIDRIETATRRYCATTDPAILSGLSRQPERVAPLIAHHYQGKPILATRVTGTVRLEPLELGRHANFWMHTVRLEDQKTRNVIIEVLCSGEPRIDWEAFVEHQPMEWDQFALMRPTGDAMDFRAYLEPDQFFSHEFADASVWNSYRLTALHSEESLFGYVEKGSPVADEILKLLSQSDPKKISVILRLRVPVGLKSRRGVVIEKLVSPCWIHLNPPDA